MGKQGRPYVSSIGLCKWRFNESRDFEVTEDYHGIMLSTHVDILPKCFTYLCASCNMLNLKALVVDFP